VKDTKAAVKWITWDTNQWISYDDEETFALKTAYATSLGLSGTMIWAVDQAVFSGPKSSTTQRKFSVKSRALSLGFSNSEVAQFQSNIDAGDACYTSFCGVPCAPGYFTQTQSSGEVGQLGIDTACRNGALANLCCKFGTQVSQCSWEGWRGYGLSCYGGGGCREGYTLLAVNSNGRLSNRNGGIDQPCNVGPCSFVRQSYLVLQADFHDRVVLQAIAVVNSNPQ
jgi:chitinase